MIIFPLLVCCTSAIYQMFHMVTNGNSAGAFKTAALTVYEALRTDIIDGKLKPGERLVRRAVAKEFGVSPIPVTEALWRLEQDGLVESEPMYGSRVRMLTAETMSNEQILREAIECQTARLLAENGTAAEFEALMKQAQRLDEVIARHDRTSREGLIMHSDFHITIARMSGYSLLVHELERAGFLDLMRVNWVNATVIEPVPDEWHQQLVTALATRDPDYAERKMREHVRFGRERHLDALRELEKSER